MSANSVFRRGMAYALCACVLVGAGSVSAVSARAETVSETTDGYTEPYVSSGSYDEYLAAQPTEIFPTETVHTDVTQFKSDYQPQIKAHEGVSAVVFTKEDGYVEWTFEVKTQGYYHIALDYYPIAGKTSRIERELHIDGARPFSTAASVEFTRVWANNTNEFQKDNNGNDVAPTQIEKPRWIKGWLLRDLSGYYTDAYRFWFSQGTHTVRLTSVSEPMAIGAVYLQPVTAYPTYAEKLAEYEEAGYQPVELSEPIYIQAEYGVAKSDQVLIPTSDRSSPSTEPYHVSKQLLNTVGGGNRWSNSGQWIEWLITVPQSGLYKVNLKAKQDVARGIVATRVLYVNGEIPFEEARKIEVRFDSEWQNVTLRVNGEEAYVCLKEGENTLRLESSLGQSSEYVRKAKELITELNTDYRKIMMITGTTPDENRDYRLAKQIPEVIESLGAAANTLREIAADMEAYSGGRNSYIAQLETFAYQLDKMYNRPDQIQRRLSDFKSNISSLGTWLVNMQSTPLELDTIAVYNNCDTLKKAESSFWAKIKHEFGALVMSFVEDYNTIGGGNFCETEIEVWIGSGRDQANVLKTLVDASFVPEHNIGVKLKLVQGALLSATVAGIGPDVALELGSGDPVNYATRHAVTDLMQFDDCEEVLTRFSESAVLPFRYNGGVYALPEKESWLMLFYRSDILAELGMSVPTTWEEVYKMLPILQRSSMNFGMPVTDMSSGSSVGGASVNTFTTLLYQNNGQYYENDGARSALDSEEAIETFRKWINMYVSYSLPTSYEFSNRFRSGEMPIGIADYTIYSTLTAFAPEIKGLWGFTVIPGTVQEDGSINHSVSCNVTSAVIMAQSDNKAAAWEFLKWYTSCDTQVSYARSIESMLGETARYPVANLEALEQLPWSTSHYKALEAQRVWVRGRPEVPGGYYTSRHIDNIFRTVYNTNADVRETVLDFVRTINDELTAKRKEFGLE